MKMTEECTTNCQLPDIQNTQDKRGIPIDKVGITNVKFPIKVKRKPEGNGGPDYMPVSARTKLFVGLPDLYKGVNMSRFYESLKEFSNHTISSATLPRLLELLQKKLKSKDAYARFEFDYYIDKTAPVSKLTAPQAYVCAFTGIRNENTQDFILEVNTIAASVCPCSREMSLLDNLNGELDPKQKDTSILVRKLFNANDISEVGNRVGMGAHNQRSNIRVEAIAKSGEMLWIEDVVALVESQASAPVYPILKRPDEKFVTEAGYNNAKFSEDITRDVQIALEDFDKIESWSLRVFNEESIHPYDVTCYQKSKNWRY